MEWERTFSEPLRDSIMQDLREAGSCSSEAWEGGKGAKGREGKLFFQKWGIRKNCGLVERERNLEI